jgi:hypothetical protein
MGVPDKPSPGQKVPRPSASFVGDTIDTVEWWKRRKRLGEPQQPKHTPINNCKVKARNSTGANVGRGRVLELTGFLLTDLEPEYLWFTGETPTLVNPQWGITTRPIPAGDIDDVLMTGVCLATISFTDNSHQFARRIAGSTVLESADRGGVKILQDPGGSSERECVVQILDDTPLWYLGITRDDFTQGVDQRVSIDVWAWNTDSDSFHKVPGFVIEARDWFLNDGEEVTKGTKVRVDWYISTWVVTAMYCSPTDIEEHQSQSSLAVNDADWSLPYDMASYYGGAESYSSSQSGGSYFVWE